MKKNIGFVDRVIRFLLALFLIDVAVNSTIQGTWQVIAWVFVGVMFLTALTARCPLYSLFHIHTNKTRQPIKSGNHE